MERKLFSLILILAGFMASAGASDWTPKMMKNPNIADRRVYVADPGHYLSEAATVKVNSMLYALRDSTSVEAAVAIVPDMGDYSIEDFAYALFEEWGLGKSDKDNGLLLLIAMEQKKVRIQTGYGVEGVLPDISCRRIIDTDIIPAMREGDIDLAVVSAVTSICRVLTDPAYSEELRSGKADNFGGVNTLSTDVFTTFLGYVAAGFFFFMLVVFLRDLWQGRKLDNYGKSMLWRRHQKVYWLGTVFSLGAGVVFAFLSMFFAGHYRKKRVKCDTCGAKMNRLNEDEDNLYLNASQDFEEKLRTVDYDVWVCPDCGTVERFPYKEKQSIYSECPRCHTVAMRLKYDKVTVPATTRQNGMGQKVYECQFCHHKEVRDYVIPKKVDMEAVAAGAVLGAMSGGHRGGGGGGFGGGFGGGHTGGGGASGGW